MVVYPCTARKLGRGDEWDYSSAYLLVVTVSIRSFLREHGVHLQNITRIVE